MIPTTADTSFREAGATPGSAAVSSTSTFTAIRVRAMVAADLAQSRNLWERTEHMGLSSADAPRALRRFLRRNRRLSRIAVTGAGGAGGGDGGSGRVVGTVLVGHDGRRGYLYHLAVDRGWRGNGIARRLLESAVAGLERAGIERCHIMIFSDNADGKSAWRRLGWRDRDDIAVMSRDLAPEGRPR